MSGRGMTWSLILAGGEGTRLRALTTDTAGDCVPKQFCAFHDGRSLLTTTLERAGRIAPFPRLLVSVLADHRRYWERELRRLPAGNVFPQPANRGTTAGILLPLLRLAHRDPEATVVVFPSDHFVEQEGSLELAIRRGLAALDDGPCPIVLLGARRERPDPGYGWMTAAPERLGRAAVTSFVEKPDAALAASLVSRGARVNTFIFAARVQVLLELCRDLVFDLFESLSSALALDEPACETTMADLYRTMPARDFSREVLAPAAEAGAIATVTIPDACGWSDLGTAERLLEVWRNLGRPRVRGMPESRGYLDLSDALWSLEESGRGFRFPGEFPCRARSSP